MGDDAISALEIANVKIQGLPSGIMVSVCSEKGALAEVMGLSDVGERILIRLRQAQVQRGGVNTGIFHFSSGHLIGSFYWAPMRDSGGHLKVTLLLSPAESFLPAEK